MTERDRKVKVYTELNLACDLIANIRERHHDDGQWQIDCRQLYDIAEGLYRWRKRLEEELYPQS